MKKYSLLLFFFLIVCTSLLFSQNSYEFDQPVPPESEVVQTVSNNHFGFYVHEGNSNLKYEFNSEGIFIHTLNIQMISRETIRESSQYSVVDNELYGVTSKPIPCILEGENYYFGFPTVVQVSGTDVSNRLIKLDENTYFLNFKTEYGYVPSKLTFVGNNQLFISELQYDNELNEFKQIKEQQKIEPLQDGLTTTILIPTKKEWEKLNKKNLFGSSQLLKRQ
ncbi:MAG TPA: hypothetical protein VKZ44_09775 [Taishania sp.]|nr:hypothetical protein [Taishania sp.]